MREDECDPEAERGAARAAADDVLVAEACDERIAPEAAGGRGEREGGEAERRHGIRRAERALEVDRAPVAHGALDEEPEERDRAEPQDGSRRAREAPAVAGDVGRGREEVR